MNISDKNITVLMELCGGATIPSSRLKSDLAELLLREGVLLSTSHGSRITYRAAPGLREYLPTLDPRFCTDASDSRSVQLFGDRASQVAAYGDSKVVAVRSCPGFPVNCWEPIESSLGVIGPAEGTFTFISDWQRFRIPEDVTVVGVENMENFRRIREQRHLFEAEGISAHGGRILFVSRYPQSGDLVRWLQGIPNRYLHFGDLDLAGVNIYLTEFYAKLGSRASFFIPEDASERLAKGSTDRYTAQYERFHSMRIADPRVEPLVRLIHHHRRGYDQEGYIWTLRD